LLCDKESAENVISHIRSPHLRNDARHDLKISLEKHHLDKVRSFSPDINELNAVLTQLEAFDDAHVVQPKHNSAHLRLLAKEIIGRIFAETMK